MCSHIKWKRWIIGLLIALVVPAGVARAESGAVHGQVLDPQQRPVAGAVVTLQAEAGGAGLVGRTDADGRFALVGISAGGASLSVEAAGFAPYRQQLAVGSEGAEVRVMLDLAVVTREIVVTAAMPELTGELVASGDDLERRASQDLAQELRGEAGMSAVRRGPINLEPTVRGLQETQVAMFVDGTRTFAAGPARMDSDISHVSPHTVQSLQVVKGPYALTWGAGTMSALDVELFRPEFSSGPLRLGGKLGFNYHDTTEASDGFGGIWGSTDRWRFQVFAGARQGHDYEAGGGGQKVPGDYRSREGNWSLGYRPSADTRIEYNGGYQHQQDIDYPGRLLDASYFYARTHALEYQWAPAAGEVSEVYAQLYSNRKDHRMNNDDKPTAQPNPARVPPFGLRVDLPTESDTTGGRFYVSFPGSESSAGSWSWKLGADAYRSEQNATRSVFRRSDDRLLFADIVWPDARIDDQGVYGQGIFRGEGYEFGATLRADRVAADAGQVSPFFAASTQGRLDQNETNLSAALSGQFRLGDGWLLSAGIGRSVRTATVLERYADRFPSTRFQLAAEFLGNPELDPESSLELDLGTEYARGGFFLELEGFYRRIDDYITVLADPTLPRRLPLSPPVVYRYVNGTRATFYGGELHLRQRLGDHAQWRAGLSYVRAEDEAFHEPAIGIPPLTATLGLHLQTTTGRYWLDAETTLAGRQSRVATARFEQETPGYAVYDLRLGTRVTNTLELHAGVLNLTDKRYAEHLNSPNPFTGQRIPEPGRNVFAGLELRF